MNFMKGKEIWYLKRFAPSSCKGDGANTKTWIMKHDVMRSSHDLHFAREASPGVVINPLNFVTVQQHLTYPRPDHPACRCIATNLIVDMQGTVKQLHS